MLREAMVSRHREIANIIARTKHKYRRKNFCVADRAIETATRSGSLILRESVELKCET